MRHCLKDIVCPKTREIFFNKIVIVMGADETIGSCTSCTYLDLKSFSVTPAKDYKLKNPYIRNVFFNKYIIIIIMLIIHTQF